MEAREIFDAAPLAISQFLSETGQGLYIPPYQRAYSWEQTKVRRLFEDIAHGLTQLTQFEDSICFLGTVIALRDLSYVTVEPIHRSQVPPKVMTIIDGQQRLTTVLILATILHEEIRLRSEQIQADQTARWLYNQALDIVGRLAPTFEEDMRYGDNNFRYYPRMIRSYHDAWSRMTGEARYESPIGFYLHSYGAHARSSDASKPYKHVALEAETEPSNREAHNHLSRVREHIRKTVRQQARADSSDDGDDNSFPSLSTVLSSAKLQSALFNSDNAIPVEIQESIEDKPRWAELLRLIVFANYLLRRVTVAVVTAKREDYGFDMFEALNTTGEPLTALETFKPKVIQAEGLKDWEKSPSKRSFDVIDAFLTREGDTADRKQSATSNLLVPFALIQSGTKLSKRLNDQRRHLRDQFDKQPDLSTRRDFLATLEQLVQFTDGPWRHPEQLEAYNSALSGDASLALAVLGSAKHDIVQAPLTRFYAAYRLSPSDEVDRRVQHFLSAARMCAAFYALWRGAHGSTAGIDDIYRKLMHLGEPDSAVPPLARDQRQLAAEIDVDLLQKYLLKQLGKGGLDDKAKWITRAASVPVYTAARPLARILLLAASHNSSPDVERPGLIRWGRDGLLETMTLERWRDDATLTIEHVAPKEANDGWDSRIYDGDNTQHTLGNLTLMPSIENSSASNRPWPVKRTMYRAFSAPTIDDAEKLIKEAADQGLILGSNANQIMLQARHLPLVAALGQREEDWSVEFVHERSERLASLAWDTLAPWLGLPKS
ncbi:DUF262 domain-containing HNH endonuclease family protein [Catellatospora sp. TT07R-123]|uniref:DUF262 domain-containing protein n=1 Tax=Catellatospora sp. TT07R-123 TaxID=2733863 RepID=UPI001BB39D17|nr:DUF262 domain-containing HNH endonuclease family protein [Catellatospora sp. TT07R-123]